MTATVPAKAWGVFMSREIVMSKLLSRCLREESGTEVIEYALLLGLVVVGCIAVLSALGVKVVGRWTTILDSL